LRIPVSITRLVFPPRVQDDFDPAVELLLRDPRVAGKVRPGGQVRELGLEFLVQPLPYRKTLVAEPQDAPDGVAVFLERGKKIFLVFVLAKQTVLLLVLLHGQKAVDHALGNG
jgi:hypothetical protein